MAPTPQNEAKEPDKTENKETDNDLRSNNDIFDDLNNSVKDLDNQDSNVSTLDDGQLKALLDEAINYKTPKDREGKSRIFKVLLHQAETEERNARAASASGPQLARYYNTSARKTRNKTATLAPSSLAASTTQGGSLQDLIATKKPLRRKKNSSSNFVSSRSREGGSLGSLPTHLRVDATEISGAEEGPSRADSVKDECVKTRGRFQSESEKDDEKSFLNEDVTHRIPRIRYTSRATLEVEACSGAQQTITVDKPVSFTQLETGGTFGAPFSGAQALQLETEYSSVKCIVDTENLASQTRVSTQGAPQVAGGPAGALMPAQYRLVSVTNPKMLHSVDKFTEKKAVDENCNSLSNCDSKKKKKCSKLEKNVTVSISEELPGHRADIIESIDLLVKFIEDDSHSNKNNKKSLNHKIENKKRRGKKNHSTVKKCNSLEEISQSKFEDLMSDDSKSKKIKNKSISEDGEDRNSQIDEIQDEFRVVTKKKKHKKRLQQQKQQYNSTNLKSDRRKSISSIAPSEKSDSSDLDSVHSLPNTGALGALNCGGGCATVSQSYAEIAKNAIAGQISLLQTQVSPQISGAPTPWKSSPMSILNPSHFPTLPTPEEAPLLGVEPPTFNPKDTAPNAPSSLPLGVNPPNVGSGEAVTPSLGCKQRRSKSNISSRPAVIILDETVSQIQGLTFGFEINQQLLVDEFEGRGGCLPPFLGVGDVFKRYSVPEHKHLYNHDKIVTYVGLAWEDILHDSAVQYYHSDMV